MSTTIETAVKERPVLFSAPMVRAILEGRKTQTRRIIKPQPENPGSPGISPIWGRGVPNSCPTNFCIHAAFNEGGERVDKWLPCPYGKPGDRLWVRETWAVSICYDEYKPSVLTPHVGTVQYRAGGQKPTCFDVDGNLGKWRPSIFMPRWASRISLEITGVRVERLQEISNEDCIAEGIEEMECTGVNGPYYRDYLRNVPCNLPWTSYQSLWEKINGVESWSQNPWVWVVEFKRI